MSKRIRVKQHLVASLTMLVGTIAVGSFVLAMNSHVRPPQKESGKQSVEFVVERQKRKAKPPPKKQEKPRKSPAKAPPVRVPDLGSNLSLAGLPMPCLDASELLGSSSDRPDPSRLVMTEEAVDNLPQAVSRVSPDYPERARRSGIEGRVNARLLIGADGRVERVRLVDSKPEGVFDEVALASLKEWSFEPATYQGQPVRVWASQTVGFRLD